MARTHGGAILPSGVENVAYDSRSNPARAEKEAIGERAAALIPSDTSLFVNIGTTSEEVARRLARHEGLMVVTNNIHVAHILTPSPRIEVIIAGGQVRKPDGGIAGESVVEFVSQFWVDWAVIGISAIDEDGALLDFDYREVMAARAIIKNARHTVLVADSMKFARTAPVRLGHISQVDVFVTDRLPPKSVTEVCKQHRVSIELIAGFDAKGTARLSKPS